jgi:hypothetical protein
LTASFIENLLEKEARTQLPKLEQPYGFPDNAYTIHHLLEIASHPDDFCRFFFNRISIQPLETIVQTFNAVDKTNESKSPALPR